jgi:plasmid maintenance system killer protein
MIKSFSSTVTEKIFNGDALTKKDRKSIGSLNVAKAQERLVQLHTADQKVWLTAPSLKYHSLKGTDLYSIDADSRNSKWRITFCWENEEIKNVELVKIEDTH